MQRRICRLVARGVSYQQAAEASGIHRDTLNDWMVNFPDFSDAVKKARARSLAERLARIEKAGWRGNWQADAWFLERVAPEQFGRHRTFCDAKAPGEVGTPGVILMLPDSGRDRPPIDEGPRDKFLLSLCSKAEANGGEITLHVDDLLEIKRRT